MNLSLPSTLLAVACLVAMGNAFADCAADYTVQDMQRSYSEAQQLERAGKLRGALAKYVMAQSYTCDTNPVEADAAKHAATLALPLGTAAEKKGDFQEAFDLYDTGGHYAAADRALVSLVRAKPDDPSLFTKAREVLEYRALPAFSSNHKVQLAVTGAYRSDARNLAEVIAMPAAGVQSALQKETAVLSEQYLRDRVQLKQSVPDDPTDAGAMQKVMLAQQSFTQKYSTDPLKASRDALDVAYRWSVASNDQAFSRKVARELAERRELRTSTLAQKFNGDPSLLEAAIDYYGGEGVDQAAYTARVPPLRAQALKLGDAAMAAKRYTLAISYYEVADADTKAQAARDEQQRAGMARMQPSIDQMKKQAEALQKQYSDPAKVQAMRNEAQALQARFRQRQQANADELEKELGL